MTTAATARTPRPPPAATTASPTTGEAAVFGSHQRHRPARPDRGLQGAVGSRARPAAAATTPTSSPPSTRPSPTAWTSSTTRSAARSTNFATRSRSRSCTRRGAGIFVAAVGRQQRPDDGTVAHPGPWTDDGRGRHPQPRMATGSVTLGNGATYYGASLATAARHRPAHRLRRRGPARRGPDAARSLLRRVDGVRRPRSRQGGGQDRRLRSRRHRPRQQEPRRPGGRRRRHDPVQHQRQLDQRRLPLRPDGPPAEHRPRRRQGLRGDGWRHGHDQPGDASIYTEPAPFTASFSSRGPLLAAGGDLLKPDVIAPGQDILAAVAPPGNAGRDFDLYSGTSMSSPHVAGLAALFKDLHPDLVADGDQVGAHDRAAYDVLDGPNTNPLVIFRQGAGHVAPNSGRRSRPRVQLRLERLARVPVRTQPQLHQHLHCARARGYSDERQRLQRRLDRDRRPRRRRRR